MEKQVLKGRIEFIDDDKKEYNREFTATLDKSCAFDYGNGTCVVIKFGAMQNGRTPESKLFDTRYEKGITKNFKNWLIGYFEREYCEHTLVFEN